MLAFGPTQKSHPPGTSELSEVCHTHVVGVQVRVEHTGYLEKVGVVFLLSLELGDSRHVYWSQLQQKTTSNIQRKEKKMR